MVSKSNQYKVIPEPAPKRREVFFQTIRLAGPDDCWEWTGYCLESGYGQFKLQCKNYRSHRVAFFLATGIQPGDHLVCHTCDNNPCCNPKHLFLGTNEDNSADMVSKGRAARPQGTKHPQAKLTEENVKMLRINNTAHTIAAKELDVSPSLVCAVRARRIWAHLP